MDRTQYSEETQRELAKPAVSIETQGTLEERAQKWEEAAFREARRANDLEDELKAERERFDKEFKERRIGQDKVLLAFVAGALLVSFLFKFAG